MALKANVFTSELESLIDQLVTLNHYQFFISSELKEAKKRVERSLQVFAEKGWKKERVAMGSVMTIFDVFHQGGGEHIINAPTKGRHTAGEDILRVADEIERRFNAWLTVSLFEALETFLKGIYGKLLFQLRHEGKGGIRDKKAFHKTTPAVARIEGTLPYFMAYAEYSCRRDCKKVLKLLNDELECELLVIRRYWKMPFDELVVALGVCRHCIVHSQSRMRETNLRALSTTQKQFLDQWMHDSLHEGAQLLLPDFKLVAQCYEVVASYARGVYVLLGKRFGMADESGYFQ